MEVKWIKIVTDLFEDEKMLLIDSMKARDGIIVIWMKLLCLAGKQNNDGVLMINEHIPHTIKTLSAVFHRPESLVKTAIETFEQFGMVEINNGVITIPNWEKHQSLDGLEKTKEKNRERVQRFRDKQKSIANNVTRNVTVTLRNADVTPLDKEEDIDRDRYIDTSTYIDSNNIVDESTYQDLNLTRDIKRTYGKFQNVRLTDEEIKKLQTLYPDWETKIDTLSVYIKQMGKDYKDHYLTICLWAEKDEKKKKSNQTNSKEGSFDTDEFFEAAKARR